MSYLKAGDTISGQEAVATIIVHNADGNNTVENMFWAKNLEASVEIEKTEVYTLGKRGAQTKPNGWKGSGNMTIYYVTSLFRRMMINYIKTGVLTYFDLTITNNDPSSTVGAQTTVLKNCCLDSVILAKFDVEADVMDESVDFTFDDVDILDEFQAPTLGG
jgi:hypothetical protein